MNIFRRIASYFGGGTAFQDTLAASIDRGQYRFMLPADSAAYITSFSRTGVSEKVEWLWQTFGIVKEGGAGISRHTVGSGISLQLESADDDFNARGEDDFETYAMTPERCDLAGRRTFYESHDTAIQSHFFRGEFIGAHALNPDTQWGKGDEREPCFQLFDSQEMQTPHAIGDGRTIIDGVEVNGATRALRYWFRDLGGNPYSLERNQVMHWYDKGHIVNQVRGISAAAQSVNRLVDIHELIRLATRSAKAQQLLAVFLKGIGKKKTRGALGAIESAGSKTDGTADPDTAQIEKLVGAAGGGIVYGDESGDAKLLTPNSPSPLVEGFITDLLMRDVCAGWGVPSEFFWNIAKLGGANTRFVMDRADRLFQKLASGLTGYFCTPVAFRYIEHRIKIGALKAPKDPNWRSKIGWQTPPRATVDNGRDAAMEIERLNNGMLTLREYYNARGTNYRTQMRQWLREPIEFLQQAKKELNESTLDPDEKELLLARFVANAPLWRAPAPGAAAQTTEEQPQQQQTEEEKAA